MALFCLKRAFPNLQVALRRSIMTSSWNSAKAQEDLEKNPYFDKYAEKIKHLQKTNEEEYLSRLKANEKHKTKVADKTELKTPTVEYPEPKTPGTFKRRELKDIMNLDLLAGKTPDEISTIWKEYYSNKEDVIYGTMKKTEFQKFIPNCQRYPTFVIPLPRGDGFEFFMVQFHKGDFHITPLILYHKYQENSPESLCISYFSELEQDVVLILGEYDNKVLSPLEAQCLLNTLQLFYHSKDRLSLVQKFHENPEAFDYNELIREINCLTLQKQ